MKKYIYLSFIAVFILFELLFISKSYAITQFYFTIPNKFQNTTGLVFSVEINNRNFSWMDDGVGLVALNKDMPETLADDTGMDLDANEYLFAIDKNVEIGTRVYMCIFTSSYMSEPLCQTDAIDKNHLARVNFDILK